MPNKYSIDNLSGVQSSLVPFKSMFKAWKPCRKVMLGKSAWKGQIPKSQQGQQERVKEPRWQQEPPHRDISFSMSRRLCQITAINTVNTIAKLETRVWQSHEDHEKIVNEKLLNWHSNSYKTKFVNLHLQTHFTKTEHPTVMWGEQSVKEVCEKTCNIYLCQKTFTEELY